MGWTIRRKIYILHQTTMLQRWTKWPEKLTAILGILVIYKKTGTYKLTEDFMILMLGIIIKRNFGEKHNTMPQQMYHI